MLFLTQIWVKKICQLLFVPLFLIRKPVLIGYLPAILIGIYKKLRSLF